MSTLPPVTVCAKSKGGILKTIGWSQYGCFKINTSSAEIQMLNTKGKRSTKEPPQAFPTILELAQLSQHVYAVSDFPNEMEVPFGIDDMEDWICIGTGRYSDGYCGAAYVNHKHSHVVIAHGGTEFKISKPMELYKDFIITDVGGVFLNKEVSQISSAYIFTKLIVNLCSDIQFSISVTGHSLGGWLAQICGFYIEHSNYITQNEKAKEIIEDKQTLEMRDYVETNKPCHLHTVSFDSPGCRRALKKIVGYYGRKAIEWRENVDTLDFTVIIAPSNSVNTCGEHVGYVLKLEMPGVQDISWFTASHGIQLFVDHLTSELPELKEVHDVYFGKAVQSEVESVILDRWYVGRTDSCQVNILSPMEVEFLTRAQIILIWRNTVTIGSSDMKILEGEKHKEASKILKDMNDEMLNDFVQNFTVKNNAIYFPENILNDREMNMSKLIWKLMRLFRLKRDWLTGHEFQDMIQDLPGCRQMLCESEGSLYLKRLPKLNDRKCTTWSLCDQVEKFLESGQHFLHIKADRGGRQSRLYMVHIFNCFRDHYKDEVGEHALFINISIVQRLSLEIKMAEIFNDTKFSLIVIECDSEINEEMNAVIRGMITYARRKEKKFIIVTSGETSCPVGYKYPPLECDVDPSLEFKNLDESSKKVISQCRVEMHGNAFMLGKSDSPSGQYLLEDVGSFFNTVNSSEIICDIFDGKYIDLSCGSLPTIAEHYIPRTLFQITLHVGKLRKNAKAFSDIIVISNCDCDMTIREIPEFDSLFEKGLIHKIGGEYTNERFLEDFSQSKFLSKSIHWFRKEGSMFVWQTSNGQPCFDYLVDDEGEIADTKLHELQNNFIILADEPGMGKSAAITKLFLEHSRIHFDSTDFHLNWPVYINLNYHQIELKNTTNSSDSAMSFLTKASNLEGDFEKLLFKFCLEKSGNVTFFIDSFDEISQKGQDFVVQMLQHLKGMNHSRIRVWIATRDYAKFELEKRLEIKSYRFHRVEEEAQIKFLVNYWTHNILFEQNGNITLNEKFAEIFATRAIKEIRNVLGEDHTFIGIPLQLVLLTLIYNDKFRQVLENKSKNGLEEMALSLSDDDWKNSSEKFSSTLELYDIFVDKKLNIWLEDKFQFQTRTDWMDSKMKASMNKILSQAAFLYVSSSILINSDINIQSLSPADSHEVNRVGFCEISKPNFRFYHQTIAEYFSAKYLVNLIRKNQKNDVVSFLKTHYHKPYFKKIRYFLDSLLCLDITGLENLELLDTRGNSVKNQSLRQRFMHEVWGGVDALNRNILHYAMAYGDHESGIFWMIAKDLSLFHDKDRLGETCLSYLCLSDNFLEVFIPEVEEHLVNGNIGNRSLEGNDGDLIAQTLQLPVLYSIFCGSEFQDWLYECIECELESWSASSDTSASESSYDSSNVKTRPGSVGVSFAQYALNTKMSDEKLKILREVVKQYVQYMDLTKRSDRNLLIKNVEINMTWLTQCTVTVNGILEIRNLFRRLCLHNSLDNNPEIFLRGWLKTCLSEDGDAASYKVGAELIRICRHHQWYYDYECVLTILRGNLQNYYNNVFPYLDDEDEYNLWTSCLDKEDKRKMFLVLINHNLNSLERLYGFDDDFLEEAIDSIYHESNAEFRDAMMKGLAIAFQVNIYADCVSTAYIIYNKSDDQAKKQMLRDNFNLRNSTTLDKPELIVHNAQTFKDIRDGNDELWTLRSLENIKHEDIQSHFFTLPGLADYPSLGDKN